MNDLTNKNKKGMDNNISSITNFEMMSNNMSNLEKCMDDILINGKMMEEMMSQNTTTDQTADNMLDVLKG